MAEETPLKQSDSASNKAILPIDYEAIFEGQGSKGHHKEFAQKTILGEVGGLATVVYLVFLNKLVIDKSACK